MLSHDVAAGQALTQSVIRLGSLDTTRDFTYIQDTVSGFIKAMEAQGVEGEQFNLGTGEEIRVGDLANLIIRKVAKPVKIEVDPARLRPEKSEVQRLVSDNQMARKRLGWEPHTSFDQGLDQTIEWVSNNIDRFRPDQYEF